MSLSLVLKFQTPSINCIDRERPWHPSAGGIDTHTHTHMSCQIIFYQPPVLRVQCGWDFRLTHSPPAQGEACNLQVIVSHCCSLVPLWTKWCVPSSLLAHRRTVCTQIHPAFLPLSSLLPLLSCWPFFMLIICYFNLFHHLSFIYILFILCNTSLSFILYFLRLLSNVGTLVVT